MGLNTIFGINGIGKDTVADEIRKNNPNLRVTSMSRIYMYVLGLSKTCDVKEKITEEQYKKLELVPQETMRKIEDNEYRQVLERMANSSEEVLFLGHLVSSLRLGDEEKYLDDRKIPKWFVDANNNLIQLVAPAEIISERRKKDNNRKRNTSIEEIIKHQSLCSKEWDRISKDYSDKAENIHIIENLDLQKTVNDIQNIIFEREKNAKNKIIKEDDDYGR